jgi:hypothetical protein
LIEDSFTIDADDQGTSEGKVSGDEIAFVTAADFGGHSMKISYKGKIAESETKFTRAMHGAPMEAHRGRRLSSLRSEKGPETQLELHFQAEMACALLSERVIL